jgi:hypothetical protein
MILTQKWVFSGFFELKKPSGWWVSGKKVPTLGNLDIKNQIDEV